MCRSSKSHRWCSGALLSPQRRCRLFSHHILVCYLSEHGRYVGRIEPSLSKNSLLRSAQYLAAFDPEVTLALARQMGHGKLTNMRVLLRRSNRGIDDPAVAQAVDQFKTQL
ncbi:MAG TPA: CRISPR-associated endonuclease Cas1 [Candidatus Tectomicrobia bacterium]